MERGIAALHEFIGEEAVASFLQSLPPGKFESARFGLPLPPDYTGIERRLIIAFPRHFPRFPLTLQVEPSPWLMWPHATKSGLCLHGFRERPITGTPETVVKDSLSRLRSILRLVADGSDPDVRNAEFRDEFSTYWALQLNSSPQDLLLLERPQSGSELFAISDPRPGKRTRTAWLAPKLESLKIHLRRVIGYSGKIRSPAVPGFYVKLQTHPDIQIPPPERLLDWLTAHLTEDDCKKFLTWFSGKGSLADRWLVLELPGPVGAPLFCLDVRSYSKQPDHGRWYGFRSARRWSGKNQPTHTPTLIRDAVINILDRTDILSRDLSKTAEHLEKARVVMVGTGSLGSAVALQLARSGIGEIILIDPEFLESANLGRHALGADDLGRSKSVALAEKLTLDLPIVKATPYLDYAEMLLLHKPELFDRTDLVIVTTADWASEVALWQRKSEGAPWALLQAWSEPHSFVGHALLAPGGAFDGQSLFDVAGNFKHKYTEWPDGGGVVPLPACGQTFIPGGASGMSNVAGMVAQVALRTLTGQLEQQTWTTSIYQPQDIVNNGGNYLGPTVENGIQHIVLERAWPAGEDQPG